MVAITRSLIIGNSNLNKRLLNVTIAHCNDKRINFMNKLTPFIACLPLLLIGCNSSGNSGSSANSDLGTFEAVNENVEAVYKVNPTDLSLTFVLGKSDSEDSTAWNKLIKILPNKILKDKVVEYQVFTDGIDNAVAFVTNKKDDESKWIFALDYEDASNPNPTPFVTTIIHEFVHILTFSDKQIDTDYQVCDTYEIQEGCTKTKSYLNNFYQQFWQAKSYQEQSELLEGDPRQEEVVTNFYEQHEDSFINSYSATNPVEDFAETFAFFVLKDKVANPTKIKDKKINFFYQYPELVAIRDEIRSKTTVRR